MIDARLIVLVMGNNEAFSDSLLEMLSDEAGDCVDSPEDLLIRLEDALSSGELTEDDIHEIIARVRNHE